MGGLLASLVRQPATQASLLASRLAQCSILTQSSSSSAALSRLQVTGRPAHPGSSVLLLLEVIVKMLATRTSSQSFHTSRSVHDEDDTKVPQTSPLQTPLAPAQPEPSTSAERPRATSRPSADHRNWEW